MSSRTRLQPKQKPFELQSAERSKQLINKNEQIREICRALFSAAFADLGTSRELLFKMNAKPDAGKEGGICM